MDDKKRGKKRNRTEDKEEERIDEEGKVVAQEHIFKNFSISELVFGSQTDLRPDVTGNKDGNS